MRTKLIVIVTLANLVTAFKIDQRSEVKECPSSFSKKEGVPGKCFHRSSNGFQQMMRARKYCEDKYVYVIFSVFWVHASSSQGIGPFTF